MRRRALRPMDALGSLIKHLVMVIVLFMGLVPLYFMVVSSFKTEIQYAESQLLPPAQATLVNFESILANPMFMTWIQNSVMLTVVSVTCGVAIACLAAYALACIEFRGRNVLFILIVALLGAPAITLVIPLFRVMVTVKLINTLPGAMLVYTGLMIPYTTYFLTGFFRRLPTSIFEAAQLDGASHWQIFRRIALPLSRPGVITLAIVNTLWVWNELVISIVFLQRNSARSLMAGLTIFQGELSSNVPAIMAGLVIAFLPMFVLYLVGLRYFMSGLTAGAEK